MDSLYCDGCGRECSESNYRGEIGLCAICHDNYERGEKN